MNQKQLYKNILFTLAIMMLFRILSVVPAWGVNTEKMATSMEAWGVMNVLSGGALSAASIMAIGVAAFITANIIMQMFSVMFDKLSAMQNGGATERKKYQQLSNIVGVAFSVFESYSAAALLGRTGVLVANSFWVVMVVGTQMFIGCMLTFGLTKLIEKYGFGDGISVILLANIVSSFPGAIGSLKKMFIREASMDAAPALCCAVAAMVVFFMVVHYVQSLQKEFPVRYAKRLSSSTLTKEKVLPVGFSLTGVMPIILSMSLIQLVTMIAGFLPQSGVLGTIAKFLTADNWFRPNAMIYSLGALVVFMLTIPCTLFYGKVTLNTERLAKNLQVQNGVITGVRPGSETEEFLNKQTTGMFVFSGCVTALIVLVPQFVANFIGADGIFYIGTASIITMSVLTGLIAKYKAQTSQMNINKVLNAQEPAAPVVFGE